MNKVDRWKDFIPPEDLAAYGKAAFGGRIGIGSRPGLLNIDTTNVFVDPKYLLCNSDTTELVAAITAVTELFRKLDLPIYYSCRDDRRLPQYRGIWNLTMGKSSSGEFLAPGADDWPASYAPRPQDVIIRKNKPSPFFGTPLESFLRYDGVDSLIVIGTATSGCIRAGVVDAFSHNFRVTVMEEGCGDRSVFSHRANLFDLDMKYADVESFDYIRAELTKKFGRTAAVG